MEKLIDVTFDFRRDTPKDKDPDIYSQTLRRYHKVLWSKQLPCGKIFTLDDSKSDAYLYHKSDVGEFYLSSDTAIHTFSKWKRMAHIIQQLDEFEVEAFRCASYTIGGMIVFPSKKIDGKSTINGARGFSPLIRDRIDLTLECIRRYYLNQSSPLSDVLNRYADFFHLFVNFNGYVNFFHLQDLVSDDYSNINFLMHFDDFKTPAVPTNLDEYLSYKLIAINFANMRNQRILQSLY
jgi:hypothetical protein